MINISSSSIVMLVFVASSALKFYLLRTPKFSH